MSDLSVNNIFLPTHVAVKSATKNLKNDSFTYKQNGKKMWIILQFLLFCRECCGFGNRRVFR